MYYDLDWAALNGRQDIVELLLASKADPNLKNEFDRIPFEEALQNGFANLAVNTLNGIIIRDENRKYWLKCQY